MRCPCGWKAASLWIFSSGAQRRASLRQRTASILTGRTLTSLAVTSLGVVPVIMALVPAMEAQFGVPACLVLLVLQPLLAQLAVGAESPPLVAQRLCALT